MTATDRPQGLATPEQVAEYLHISPLTLKTDRYHRRGIPYSKVGRRVVYRWIDVHEYVDSRVVTPTA